MPDLAKMQEIANAIADRHPRLYANLEQLLDQRQRVAFMILHPHGEDSDEQFNNKLIEFDNIQNLIKKYLGL